MLDTMMTDRQSTVRNADVFREELKILSRSGIGVILCRTREPHRAIEAVKAYAFSTQMPFANWSPLFGWENFDHTKPTDPPTVDNERSPNIALAKIGGIGDSGGVGFENGYYTMMFPHFYMEKNVSNRVPIIFILKEYARMFAASKRRLIMVCPLGFNLPDEVKEDVITLDFKPPSFAELGTIYDNLMEDAFGAKRPRFNEAEKSTILRAGAGMTATEFETAVARTLIANSSLLPNVPLATVVLGVMDVKTEVVKRSEVLEVMPSGSMDDVGGLDQLKDWVARRANCFSQEARDFGIDMLRGCALIGPPGTGKSLAAMAIASVLGVPLIKFNISRVFQGLVGASEERVDAALQMLDGMAPCVVLLDEVDKVFQTNSGGGDSGVSQRVLGLILSHMQESTSGIFWVASANRVDNLPAEFLRKGRLDEVFSVSIPDEAERDEIIAIHLRKRGWDPADVPGLAEASKGSEGYVPSELEQAVKDAMIDAFTNEEELTGALIAKQLENMRPLSEAFADQFKAMQEWAEQNARPASSSIIERRKAGGLRSRAPRERNLELDG